MIALALLAGCNKKPAPPPLPEADPAKIQALAKIIHQRTPTFAAVPVCQDGQLAGGAGITYRTLLELEGAPLEDDRNHPEHQEWINPHELDDPAARTLADAKSDVTAKRQAAAALLAAPFYVVYHVDDVNAPIALGIKELKIGTVGTRVFRYEKTGEPTCVIVFAFQNDKAKSDWAIAKSDRALIDPAIAKAMRDDLHDQFVAKAPRGTPPAKTN